MADYMVNSVIESCKVKNDSFMANKKNIKKVIDLLYKTLKNGQKIMVVGNGGSAADAQHLAAEFVVRLTTNRKAYPAIALTTDSSILTACANDFGFDIFLQLGSNIVDVITGDGRNAGITDKDGMRVKAFFRLQNSQFQLFFSAGDNVNFVQIG